MAKKSGLEVAERVEGLIYVIRGQRVMLDSTLASIYEVPRKNLTRQLRRNIDRFPKDFAFQLNAQEFATLRRQIGSAKRGGSRQCPWVFTEHGAIMLAAVLNSQTAISASVRVVRAFVLMREEMASHKELSIKLNSLESRLDGHDENIRQIFHAIRELIEPPKDESPRKQIGFHVKDRSLIKAPIAGARL